MPNPTATAVEDVKRHYDSPPNPAAMGGIRAVARKFKIPANQAEHILGEIDAYGVHRQYKKPKRRNPYFIYYKRQQIQLDLVEFSKLSKFNNGVKHLMCAIDCFSKKLWVHPLKSKHAAQVVEGLEIMFAEMGRLPKTILCDRGTELKNTLVKNYLLQQNVKLVHPFSEVKAGIVERVNETLQLLVYRYMDAKETRRYIDALPDIVLTYNSRPHESLTFIDAGKNKIELTPLMAELEENRDMAVSALRAHYFSVIKSSYKIKFKPGDTVRIKINYGDRFARGYEEQFSREIFKVVSVHTRMPVPMYRLQSTDTDEIIEGGFYQNEMTAARGDIFRVEKVLKTRVRRGVKECFVKWLDYGDQHNCWIPESNFTNEYDNDDQNDL
jgi:hypothetical protein